MNGKSTVKQAAAQRARQLLQAGTEPWWERTPASRKRNPRFMTRQYGRRRPCVITAAFQRWT